MYTLIKNYIFSFNFKYGKDIGVSIGKEIKTQTLKGYALVYKPKNKSTTAYLWQLSQATHKRKLKETISLNDWPQKPKVLNISPF